MEIENRESSLTKSIDLLASHLERTHISEYIQMLHHPLKLMWINFIMGVSRGFGIAIGMTIVVAAAAYLLSRLINIPILGQFIAEIVKIVQQNMVKM